MKIYIVFNHIETEDFAGNDILLKVFANEQDAVLLAHTNKQFWYDEFLVE